MNFKRLKSLKLINWIEMITQSTHDNDFKLYSKFICKRFKFCITC